MILITSTGLVVAAGTITSDDTYYYCNNFAFPQNDDYTIVSDVELPANMKVWHCNYVDGNFSEIIDEPKTPVETEETL